MDISLSLEILQLTKVTTIRFRCGMFCLTSGETTAGERMHWGPLTIFLHPFFFLWILWNPFSNQGDFLQNVPLGPLLTIQGESLSLSLSCRCAVFISAAVAAIFEKQGTVLIVFIRTWPLAGMYCCWLTQSLEAKLLSQVHCVWRRRASSAKYSTEEVDCRGRARRARPQLTPYVGSTLYSSWNIDKCKDILMIGEGMSHDLQFPKRI